MFSRRASLLASTMALVAMSLAPHARAAVPAVKPGYQHVMLISVDGMHAVDLANWISANPKSQFARMANHALIYSNAFTTAPSDSFPGMLAQVTGATPKSAGLY
jgi:predicted AlkP superfamily pyrophosphatase or phosphodiesterase